MSKKKKPAHKNNSPKKRNSSTVNKPPKWGLIVAAVFAFLLVSVAMIVMDKMGINNGILRTVIVLVLALCAGIGARPLTFALQKRFGSNDH